MEEKIQSLIENHVVVNASELKAVVTLLLKFLPEKDQAFITKEINNILKPASVLIDAVNQLKASSEEPKVER